MVTGSRTSYSLWTGSTRWWGLGGKVRGGVREGDQLPGERPLRDGARDKCSPRPPFTGIISTILICCSISIHTRLPWMETLEKGRQKVRKKKKVERDTETQEWETVNSGNVLRRIFLQLMLMLLPTPSRSFLIPRPLKKSLWTSPQKQWFVHQTAICLKQSNLGL